MLLTLVMSWNNVDIILKRTSLTNKQEIPIFNQYRTESGLKIAPQLRNSVKSIFEIMVLLSKRNSHEIRITIEWWINVSLLPYGCLVTY